MANIEEAIPQVAPEDGMERGKSMLRVSRVLEEGERRRTIHHAPEDERIANIVEERIARMDEDGDGRIDSKELYSAMMDVSKAAIHADKKNRNYKHIIYGLVGFTVVLVAAVFGTSIAAARLAKDTQVNNRALLTKDGQAVGINMNEVNIPLGAVSFMPSDILTKIDQLILNDMDGAVHRRTAQAITIVPEKSLTLLTTNGDKVTWDADADERFVTIELKDGSSWKMSSSCAACTATSVVADEAVMGSLNKFRDSLNVSKEDRRRLQNDVCESNLCKNNPEHQNCVECFVVTCGIAP